jgi:uncharacterized membrane protein (UPF0127 family)
VTDRRPSSPRSPSRRRLLRHTGVALAVGATGTLAGCLGAPDDGARATTTGDDVRSTTTDGRTDEAASPATATPDPTPTATATPIHPGYDTTEVRVETPDGDRLGSVTAAIADTRDLRFTGLSDTESLPADRGMLFVYDGVRDLVYVMRRMDFGIDIVYADDAGVVTRIHHAPAPGPEGDGSEQEYPGRGQYVLEVNYDWTTDHGVEVGDVLRFDV